MSSQYIAFAKTTVSPEKTAAEIEEMLRKADVQKVGKVYEAGRITSIYFQMDTADGSMPFILPVKIAPIYQAFLNKRKTSAPFRYSSIPEDIKASIYAQAERTAWRNIHWWLKVQLTMIALRMVEVSEVFLPYMLVAEQETLYQRLVSGGFKALAAGKEQRL